MTLLLTAHEDIPEHQQWLSVLEQSVDTIFTLEALPVGKAADVQMRLLVSRPNRWGRAFDPATPPDADAEVYCELYAAVTERSIVVRQNVQ
jgi:hypothetical protein